MYMIYSLSGDHQKIVLDPLHNVYSLKTGIMDGLGRVYILVIWRNARLNNYIHVYGCTCRFDEYGVDIYAVKALPIHGVTISLDS